MFDSEFTIALSSDGYYKSYMLVEFSNYCRNNLNIAILCKYFESIQENIIIYILCILSENTNLYIFNRVNKSLSKKCTHVHIDNPFILNVKNKSFKQLILRMINNKIFLYTLDNGCTWCMGLTSKNLKFCRIIISEYVDKLILTNRLILYLSDDRVSLLDLNY